MKPEQAEIDRLRKEVAKLKMERDILKKTAACIVLNVSCGSRLCGHAPDAVDCRRAAVNAVRLLAMFWTA